MIDIVSAYLQLFLRKTSGKITFIRDALLSSFVHENPLQAQRHEIVSRNYTRDSKLSYGENLSLSSHLVLDRYWVVTDRQTNRRTEMDKQNYHS